MKITKIKTGFDKGEEYQKGKCWKCYKNIYLKCTLYDNFKKLTLRIEEIVYDYEQFCFRLSADLDLLCLVHIVARKLKSKNCEEMVVPRYSDLLVVLI